MTKPDDVVLNHLHATTRVFGRALTELKSQVSDDALQVVATALAAGCMARTTTTLSLAGAMMISFDLVAPNGQVVNLGCVEFDCDMPTLN